MAAEQATLQETRLSVADAAAMGAHVLAALRRAGLTPDAAKLETVDLDALAKRAEPAVLFLRSGAAVAMIGEPGARRLIGKGGAAAAFEASALQEIYVGCALTPLERPFDAQNNATAQDAPADAAPSDAPPALEIGPEMETLFDRATAGATREISVTGLAARLFGRIFGARFALLAQLCLAAAVSNLFAFALPIYTMAVYDRVIPHGAMHTLTALTGGVALVLILDLLLRIVKARLIEAIALKTSHEFQDAIFHRLTRAELDAAPRSTGAVSSTFSAVDGLCLTAPMLVVSFLIDLPFAVLVLFYIASVGGWLVAAPIAAILALVAVNFAAHLSARRASTRAAALTADRVGFLDQTVSLMESVKTTTAAPFLSRIWSRILDASSVSGYEQRMASNGAAQAAATISQATTVAVLVIGAHLAAEGAITTGAMVATSILVGRAIGPVGVAFGSALRFMQTLQGAKPAAAILSAPAEAAGDVAGEARRRLQGAIDFRNVTFHYPYAGAPALKDVSFSIRPGERVAIIGRIGCGKSTALRLMLRLRAPQSGAVLLDGRDIGQFDPLVLRSDMAFLAQEADLFDDSIYENLALGQAAPSTERMEAAAAASGLAEIAARQSEGYSFQVGPGGRRLSGGERQMVALSRALARPAPILLLDEPTASLDNQHELAVVERLKPLLQGRTLILSTHRAPSLQLVERVIWLDQGRVVADGPKDEVLRRLGAR